MDEMKQCTKCKVWMPATSDYFHRTKRQRCGLNPHCKRCRAAIEKAGKQRYREANKDRLAEYNRRYAQENKGMVNEKSRRYARRHPDRIKHSRARNYAKCGEIYRQQHKEYTKSHPEIVNARNNRRRASKRNLPNGFTSIDWLACCAYFSGRCAVCGYAPDHHRKLAMDHWIPLSDPRPENPGTVPTNIVPLCHGLGGCNNSKKSSDPIEWLNVKFGQVQATEILARIETYFVHVASL